jgi:hypothetical protein
MTGYDATLPRDGADDAAYQERRRRQGMRYQHHHDGGCTWAGCGFSEEDQPCPYCGGPLGEHPEPWCTRRDVHGKDET